MVPDGSPRSEPRDALASPLIGPVGRARDPILRVLSHRPELLRKPPPIHLSNLRAYVGYDIQHNLPYDCLVHYKYGF